MVTRDIPAKCICKEVIVDQQIVVFAPDYPLPLKSSKELVPLA